MLKRQRNYLKRNAAKLISRGNIIEELADTKVGLLDAYCYIYVLFNICGRHRPLTSSSTHFGIRTSRRSGVQLLRSLKVYPGAMQSVKANLES